MCALMAMNETTAKTSDGRRRLLAMVTSSPASCIRRMVSATWGNMGTAPGLLLTMKMRL